MGGLISTDVASEQSVATGLQSLRRQLRAGRGIRREIIVWLLEAVVKVGVPILLVLSALLYSMYLSDFRQAKLVLIHLVVPALLAVWLLRQAISGRLRLRRSPLYLPFFIYVVAAILALVGSHNPARGGEILLFQIWCFLLAILVMHHFSGIPVVMRAVWSVVLSGLVVAVVGLLQYNGVHLLPGSVALGNLPVSTLGNPNFAAHYLELVIPLLLVLMFWRTRVWERVGLLLAAVCVGGHLVLTMSRAGWLAAGVAIAVLLRSRLRFRDWLSCCLSVLIVMALLSPALKLVLEGVIPDSGEPLSVGFHRIVDQSWKRVLSSFDPADFSIAQRRVIWADSRDLITGQPWLGVGPGNYELVLPAYRTVERHRQWNALMENRTNVPYYAHNEYVEFWAETGVVGLAAMLWFFVSVMGLARRGLRCVDTGPVHLLQWGCVSALSAALVHSFFSFNLQDPTSAVHFWFLVGLSAALSQAGSEDRVFLLDCNLAKGPRVGLVVVALTVVVAGWAGGVCILAGDLTYTAGRRQLDKGHPSRAIVDLRRAAKWHPWEFRYHHALGSAYMQAGHYAEAELVLRRARQLHPNEVRILRLLGQALYTQKDPGASAILRRAVELEPLNPENYVWTARAYYQNGNYQKATTSWRQALALKPHEAVFLRNLGLSFFRAGRIEDAVVTLEQAGIRAPRDALIHGNLGVIHAGQGHLAEAEVALLRAVECAPEEMSWWWYLARVYRKQERWEEALQAAERALELVPDHEQLRFLIAVLRMKEGGE